MKGEDKGDNLSRRGPRAAAKRAAIVAAARRLFMSVGFAETSMDALAAAAGVSKATLYSHFADKESLFESIMRAEIEGRPVHTPGDPADAEGFRAALESLGVRLISILSDPDIQACERALVPHRERFPRLMRVLYDNGPERMRQDVARLLDSGVAHGHLRPLNSRRVADHLVSMWRGLRLRKQELGLVDPPRRRKVRDHAASCVDLVMRAYGRKN